MEEIRCENCHSIMIEWGEHMKCSNCLVIYLTLTDPWINIDKDENSDRHRK